DGVGTFPFTVRKSNGDVVVRTQATTTVPDQVAPAAANPISLDPGSYLISEDLPTSNEGTWEQVASGCHAERVLTGRGREARSLQVDISSNAGQVCQFENRFIPDGRITILKTTVDGTGTTGFVITPVDDPGTQYQKTATTTEPDRATLATGDSTR